MHMLTTLPDGILQAPWCQVVRAVEMRLGSAREAPPPPHRGGIYGRRIDAKKYTRRKCGLVLPNEHNYPSPGGGGGGSAPENGCKHDLAAQISHAGKSTLQHSQKVGIHTRHHGLIHEHQEPRVSRQPAVGAGDVQHRQPAGRQAAGMLRHRFNQRQRNISGTWYLQTPLLLLNPVEVLSKKRGKS